MDKVYVVVLYGEEGHMEMVLKVFLNEEDAWNYVSEQMEEDKQENWGFSYNVVERKVW